MDENTTFTFAIEVTNDQNGNKIKKIFIAESKAAQRVIDAIAESLEVESTLTVDDISDLPSP